jgi:hypothetical protein
LVNPTYSDSPIPTALITTSRSYNSASTDMTPLF